MKKKAPPEFQQLDTPWMDQPEVPWDTYPRPQLVRDSFLCLNGKWELFRNGESWGQILVPYPPQSRLSLIGREVKPEDVLVYERRFTLPRGFRKDRVLLHFGAVDQQAKVWVNGSPVGGHEGGYLPFHFDITPCLQEENTLRLEVRDPLDRELPYGKQRYDRGGMWYTPVSGIWQTVWLESVPENYIRSVRIDTDMSRATITVTGGAGEKRLLCDGKTYSFTGSTITISPEAPRLWSPEEPNLYPFTLESGADRVESYFALRKIECKKVGGRARLCLNGKPYFFHGLLDQGYFSDGIYLPGSPEGYTFDVKTMKQLGFNTLRKHIKIEPERFYYDCDRIGMVVFQDLVNCGSYHYIMDTLLPTLGWRSGLRHKATPRRRAAFEQSARDTLEHLHNHPCILYYTLFNEGWGQFDEQRLYELMKSLEPDRVWDATSGWFYNCDSDVLSRHIYFGSLKMKADHRPLVLSEFGGYSCSVPGHTFNPQKVYGYGKYADAGALQQGLTRLYENNIIPQVAAGLCAAILTQVSDVEDETNGMVTYDRRVVKADPAEMRRIGALLRRAMEDSLS